MLDGDCFNVLCSMFRQCFANVSRRSTDDWDEKRQLESVTNLLSTRVQIVSYFFNRTEPHRPWAETAAVVFVIPLCFFKFHYY